MQNEPNDTVRRIYGVGGSELVFSKQLERIQAGDLVTHDFPVEIGAMEYGLELDGILGLDFLVANKAVIDLETLELRRRTL